MDIISKINKSIKLCADAKQITIGIENPEQYFGSKDIRLIEKDFKDIVGFPLPNSMSKKDLKGINKTEKEVIDAIEYYFSVKEILRLQKVITEIVNV